MEYQVVFSTQYSGESMMMGPSRFKGSVIRLLNNHAAINSPPALLAALSLSFCLFVCLPKLPSLSLQHLVGKATASGQLEAPG